MRKKLLRITVVISILSIIFFFTKENEPIHADGQSPMLGEIYLFTGGFAPRGYALCKGQELQISEHDALFSILGTTYGGNGATTFALPDLQHAQPAPDTHYIIALVGTYPVSGGGSAEAAVGEIRMFAGNFAPGGYAFCDGQLLQINQNQALFSLLGTNFGGDGRMDYGLPDLRGYDYVLNENVNGNRYGDPKGVRHIIALNGDFPRRN